MRAHRCCRGGWCDCPYQWEGHGCPMHQHGRLVHECGVTLHPSFLEHPVRPRVQGALKLSILTPTYQRHAEVLRCIEAVVQQTYRPLEMVIVGDGPDPDLYALVNEWKAEHDLHGAHIVTTTTGHRFAPLDRDKGGTPWLVAAALASGDVCAIVPDDDILLPTYAEDVIRAFEDGADVYESRCHVIDTKFGGQSEMHDIVSFRWELPWWQPASFDFEKGTALDYWRSCGAKFAYGEEHTVIRSVEPSDKPEMTGSVR